MARRKRKFRFPMVLKDKVTVHPSMGVRPDQVVEANAVAREVSNLAPFRGDGKLEASRSEMKKYVVGLNKKRADLGLPPIVNFDGGYGDPT